jgi:hypothetical protein
MPSQTDSQPSDRRAEPRLPATGQVRLRPKGFAAGNVPGQMMDINSSGFRARHGFPTLGSGHTVEFAYGSLQGQARVVWTRILGDQVESGFLILSREPA